MIRIRYKLYIGMMAAALLLPSCSQEEDAALPTTGADAAAQPLSVRTRAGADETFDSFRLYLHDLATNTETEEHILTWDGTTDAWLENGRQPVTVLLPAVANATVHDATNQITFENVVQDGELHSCTVTCNIPTDQTNADKLEAAGKLMFAFNPRLDKEGSLSLAFRHACSKLVFTVDNDAVKKAGGEGKLTGIKINADNTSIYTYNYGNEANGVWTNGVQSDGNSGFDCFYDETNKTITAYIGYKEYKAGDVLMTLNVDGIPRNVPINADLTVKPGNIYTFNLDITPKEITASFKLSDDSNLFGWGSEDEEKEL